MSEKATKLTAFLKKNKIQQDNFELKLESFEQPIELRIITSKENDQLQKQSMKKVREGRKTRREFDGFEYNKKLAMASLVVPDLTNTELQESYGVMGETELYDAMFNYAEQSLIALEIQERAGLNQDINDDIDEAGN